MKILSIGNSFSVDATTYLHDMAKCCGIELDTVNLYIGGCSLYTHYVNAVDDRASYELYYNGDATRFFVSIKQALLSDDFDIVTLQQASHFSFKAETYHPYISYFENYIKKYCPHAKIYVHETWGYRSESDRLSQCGFSTHAEMYMQVEKTYLEMLNRIEAFGLIPSGKAMAELDAAGFCGESAHRDDIHVSIGLGRYTLALTWLEYITGFSVYDCSFSDIAKAITEDEMNAAKNAAHSACEWAQRYKK